MVTFSPSQKHRNHFVFTMVTLKLGKDPGVISISITILAAPNLRHPQSLRETITTKCSVFYIIIWSDFETNVYLSMQVFHHLQGFVFALNFNLFIKSIDLNLINVSFPSFKLFLLV